MDYLILTPSVFPGVAYEADKKAIDAARQLAGENQKEFIVWRKVATVTPVTTTEVTMHTEGGK